MKAGQIFLSGALIGAVVLVRWASSLLSDEAIMTLVGVMCGIVASIPISILLLIALTRERTVKPMSEANEPAAPPYAPHIVVTKPAPRALPPGDSNYPDA